MLHETTLRMLGLSAVGLPLLSFLVLGVMSFLWYRPSETLVARMTASTFLASVLCAVAIAIDLAQSHAPHVLPLGHLFEVKGYVFELSFVLDRLSVTMLVLTTSICGLVGRFAFAYLHREPGFTRFFMLLSLFAAAMTFLVLSGGLDQLFLGWELVGFTSWLLIAFFWHRKAPVDNALRVFVMYRACDVGLLLGAASLHHFAHHANLDEHAATQYPIMADHVEPWQAALLSLCLLLAAMGKSAQFPFSTLLPRAMEGPTPSSAMFYGALSVHAGTYLLLRAEPILSQSSIGRTAVVLVGLVSAVMATLAARVTSDVKTTLAYAVVTQVGLIFVEIGLGFPTLALVHMASHAVLRTLQLLRAPSALAEANRVRALSGGARFSTGAYLERMIPARWQLTWYRAALERFYLDTLLDRLVATPILRLADTLERLEQRWCNFLCQAEPDPGDAPRPSTQPSEEAP